MEDGVPKGGQPSDSFVSLMSFKQSLAVVIQRHLPQYGDTCCILRYVDTCCNIVVMMIHDTLCDVRFKKVRTNHIFVNDDS